MRTESEEDTIETGERTYFDIKKFIVDKQPVQDYQISEAMANNSDLLGYYGHQSVLWDRAINNLKLKIEVRSAEAQLEVRSSGDKITAGEVEARVSVDTFVRQLKAGLNVAIEQHKLYTVAHNTMKDRGDMLRSLGVYRRAEMENLGMRMSDSSKPKMSAAEAKEMAKNLASRD